MADLEDYPSDSSDDDYVPDVDSGDEDVSDVEEKDDEAGESGEEHVKSQKTRKSTKRKLKSDNTGARKRKGGITLEVATDKQRKDGDITEEAGNPCNEQKDNDNSEREKERVDALWANFMNDVDVKPKINSEKPAVPSTSNGSHIQSSSSDQPNKVTVTKVYEFAGEEIRVTEQVDVNSKDAKLAEIQEKPVEISEPAIPKATVNSSPAINNKRPAGLGSILSKLSGKKKLSTLDKSLLDWKDFKHKEGINEELTAFNKGKDGYLEKQAFLQRADQRQFEVEKNLRLANRSNR